MTKATSMNLMKIQSFKDQSIKVCIFCSYIMTAFEERARNLTFISNGTKGRVERIKNTDLTKWEEKDVQFTLELVKLKHIGNLFPQNAKILEKEQIYK
jgi:hypothetical protein